MTRTTIDLDASVLRALRRRGARDGKSMGALASELLARALESEPDAPAPPFAWTARKLGTPRVNLEDKEAVRRLLDGG